MDEVRGDFLGPPYGTTPAAVIKNKSLDPLRANKLNIYKNEVVGQSVQFRIIHSRQ